MLKIDRATKHIRELNELFRKSRPFSYILETNTKTGERSTRAKKNEPVIDIAALAVGDAVHNIRSAIDHANWEIVSPFANGSNELQKIQFPFSKTEARLCERIKHGLADRAGDRFFEVIKGLKPHGEAGGNELLYFLHEMDILDKHKLLTPTGDYTRLSSSLIRAQAPDFPTGIGGGSFGENRMDVVWQGPRMNRHERRAFHVADTVFEQELNVPVDIVFSISPLGNPRPVIPTLNALIDVGKHVIKDMRDNRP